MRRLLLTVLVWFVAGTPAWGDQKSIEMNAEIPAHEWNSTRLLNVNQGSTLEFEFASDGDIKVLLLDKDGFNNFPDVSQPLFRSDSSDRIKFSVVVPKQGDYFLVVDNTEGDLKAHYIARIKASTNTMAHIDPQPGASHPLILAAR
ncbi:hypothetical protein [Nitrospina watsonii]|uniref:Peptidase C-terminal archaeal/bacterial domain-containing protein n=1 Tax=Nitrospina watsonii TaxID=1323948 RepID=A0ABM9HG01_9BACT|nr:hypothetical protein [Nitrospina watsonii]CAI2719130.1 conserved protein of unknown function [Nitrospina watsonii]